MKSLTVESSHGSYEVVAEAGAVSHLGEVLAEAGPPSPGLVVTNTTVGPLWGQTAADALNTPFLELLDGEAHKRWATVEYLLGQWLGVGLHRGDSVLAVGGGVLTDTVGFAAAVYLRGIRWSAVPTTLLAMIDASVGGKTGVNLEQGKNLAGAFWPPRLVVIDVNTLTTLPERELRAGLAEVIKTAWIGDHDLLELFSAKTPIDHASLSPADWEGVVLRCLEVKARIVSTDERETGQRASLNLGHTLGHALEAATGYQRFLHGEAVAWGLLAAARLGERRNLLAVENADRLRSAVAALGELPPITDLENERVRTHMGKDKKRDDEGIAWVLPTDDGVALNQRVSTDEAIAVFEELKRN
jgi:3-dehydroquinate synthase